MRKFSNFLFHVLLIIQILLLISYSVVYAEGALISQSNRIEVSKNMGIKIIPKVVDGIAFIPIKCFYESLGWKVIWNSEYNTIIANNTKQKTVFKVGLSTVIVDNCCQIQLEAPITIIGNRAFVCSTFITREFGLKVVWDKVNNTLIAPKKDMQNIQISGKGNIIIVSNGLILNIYEPYGKDTAQDMISYADRILSGGNPAEAIKEYKEILDNISEAQSPNTYAYILCNMGNAFSKLAELKDLKTNLNKAIELYSKALNIYINNNILDYQFIYNNLGLAYRNLYEVTSDKKYLNLANNMFTDVTKEKCSEKNTIGSATSATIEYNLGRVLLDLGYTDLAKPKLLKTLSEYNKFMDVYSINSNPYEWSDLIMKLGNLYMDMSLIDDSENNLMKSLSLFEEALKVRNVESYPLDYANIHKSLGSVYTYLSSIHSGDTSLLKAIEVYNESLKVYSIDDSPFKYAWVNYKLGILYMQLGNIEDKVKNHMKSKRAFERALKVFIESEYPELNKSISGYITGIKYKL